MFLIKFLMFKVDLFGIGWIKDYGRKMIKGMNTGHMVVITVMNLMTKHSAVMV